MLRNIVDGSLTVALQGRVNAVGYPLFLIGLGAASELSIQAFWAASAASLGSLLFTMADHERRADVTPVAER